LFSNDRRNNLSLSLSFAVYISEISQAAHRGQLVTWSEIATNIGIVLGFLSGLVFSTVDENVAWRLMFSLGAILPCFVIYFSTFVMPESPRWLVAKNREGEAREVLKKVYPDGYNVGIIVKEIKDTIEVESIAEHAVGWDVILFPSPAIKRMIMVGVGTAIAQQAVGIDAIQYFLVYILSESGIQSRSAQMWILVVLGLIKLGVIVIAGHLFDRKGRRPLMFVSLLGCSVSLFIVSMSFIGAASSEGMAIFGLALYLAFFSIGMGPGAWLIPSEVFSTMIRAKAMSLATFMNRVTATIMSSTFLSVATAMSWSGFFIMMAIVCLIILAWMYVYLPETKGRPLEDMSQYFAEITGDRSILEAEETLYRREDQAEFRAPEPAVQPQRQQPKRNVAPERPPPEDAHVMGTMA
jgi:MFS family permease